MYVDTEPFMVVSMVLGHTLLVLDLLAVSVAMMTYRGGVTELTVEVSLLKSR